MSSNSASGILLGGGSTQYLPVCFFYFAGTECRCSTIDLLGLLRRLWCLEWNHRPSSWTALVSRAEGAGRRLPRQHQAGAALCITILFIFPCFLLALFPLFLPTFLPLYVARLSTSRPVVKKGMFCFPFCSSLWFRLYIYYFLFYLFIFFYYYFFPSLIPPPTSPFPPLT